MLPRYVKKCLLFVYVEACVKTNLTVWLLSEGATRCRFRVGRKRQRLELGLYSCYRRMGFLQHCSLVRNSPHVWYQIIPHQPR